MSLISSGIVNSDEGGLHLNVNSDESKTSLLLYIAPPPFRPDTPQIPVSRSLGLYRRKSNRRIITAVPTPIKHRHSREQSSAQRQQRGWSGSHSPLVSGICCRAESMSRKEKPSKIPPMNGLGAFYLCRRRSIILTLY